MEGPSESQTIDSPWNSSGGKVWLILDFAKKAYNRYVYYWLADNSRGEVDFVVQKEGKMIPIEVKAEENLRSKSLAAFVAKYPGLHALRFSMSDYREQDWMTNIPLYAATEYW